MVTGVILKFKVAVLQPVTTVTSVCAVVYVTPFAGQVYDSPAHIEVVTLPSVVTGVMFRFKVSFTVQPLPFIEVPV